MLQALFGATAPLDTVFDGLADSSTRTSVSPAGGSCRTRRRDLSRLRGSTRARFEPTLHLPTIDARTTLPSPRACRHRARPQDQAARLAGRLEALALQIACVQARDAPRIASPQLFVFAGDHGLAAQGVSAVSRRP